MRPALLRRSEDRLSRVAREAITSSGASTQLAPSLLPKERQHCLPAEIGSLVTCRTFLPLPAFRRDWDRCPDHPVTMHVAPESGKQKIWEEPCG